MKGWLTFLELPLFFLIRLFISKSLFFIFFKWSFVRISHSYYCDDLIFFSYKRKALHTGHYDLILSSGCKIIPFAESFSVPGCPYPPFPVSWRSCSIPLATEPSSKEKPWGTADIVCLIPSVRKNWSNVRTVHVMGEKVTTLWNLSGAVAASLLVMEVEKWIDFWMHKSINLTKSCRLDNLIQNENSWGENSEISVS